MLAQARDELLSREQARLSSQRRRAQLNLSKRLTERLVSSCTTEMSLNRKRADAHSHLHRKCGLWL
jgi:hypothetical protein